MPPLTDTAIRNAKPRATAYKLSDSGGLYLSVTPAGGKLFRMDFRFEGKRQTLSLGKYGVITLVEARAKRDEAKNYWAAVSTQVPPSARKKLRRKKKRAGKPSPLRRYRANG